MVQATATSRTLHDQAYQALYQAIMDGKLEPGARVTESTVSNELGISRGPVREAIRRLESEGLLVSRAHRDTHVVDPSATEVLHRYAVRAALEGFAASAGLATLRAEHLDTMEVELDEFERAAQASDWTRVSTFDMQWHGHIVRSADNPTLTAMWTTVFAPLRLLFIPTASLWRPDQWRARHTDLLDILRTGAPMTIEQAIRRHYLESARTVAEDVERRAAQRAAAEVSRSKKLRLSLVDTSTPAGHREQP